MWVRIPPVLLITNFGLCSARLAVNQLPSICAVVAMGSIPTQPTGSVRRIFLIPLLCGMGKKELNETQKRYLGMAVSTARSRLYKELIFSLTKECGKNNCYRCGKQIESSEDFTVDHKTDWRYKEDANELFFDLDNIAFSHHSCNSACVGGRRRKKGKSGHKGITYCKDRNSPNKFRAMVYWKKKRHMVGYFENADEAAEAYKAAVVKIQGSQAVDD